MIKRLAFICFIFVQYSIISQSSNTVLWKISGKNLSKPSYLFGTVHLKDKRIFYTNDSVSQYIKSCDVFASELHPDSLNALFFNTSAKSDTADVFKNNLNNDEYQDIDKKLQNDFGLSLKQIKNKNYRLLKLLLNPIEEKKDDYPTFLDGYLMAIAKRMDKAIIGLENTNSHESALTSLKLEENFKKEVVNLSKVSKNKEPLENIIKLYLEGNIDKIQDNMSSLSYETQHDLIYIRNKIMAYTIDSIIKDRTLFATCGSAHLAGDNGIIEILREMGYTLTPIFSSQKSFLTLKGLPENFNSWQKITNSSFGFNYQLPGSPIAYNKTIILSDMQMYLDMTSGASYLVMPLTVAVDVSDRVKVYTNILESLKKKSYDKTITNHHTINYNGSEGYEIIYNPSLKIAVKMRLFIENNILYMFIVSYNNTQANDEEFNHFFNSISFYKPASSDIYEYSNSNWGISMSFPAKPNEKNDYYRNSKKVEMLTLRSSDNISSIQYIMQFVEAGAGKYFEVDSVILNRMSKYFAGNESVVSVKDTAFLHEGLRCKKTTAFANDESCIINWSILKGYKLYNLMAILSKSTIEKNVHEHVFNSIRFDKINDNESKIIKAPMDSLLTFKLIEKFEKYDYGISYTDNLDTLNPLYQSYDPRTGITYYLIKDVESDYYYTMSDSIKWKNIEDDLVAYNDTLVYSSNIQINHIPAKEFIVKTKGITALMHCVVLNFDKHQYKFYSYLPENEKNNSYEFPFKNISYAGTYNSTYYSDTTAFTTLLTDVLSSDTVKKQKSRSTIYGFKLTENMFPQVKRVLNSTEVLTDTVGYEFDVKDKIITKLNSLPDSLVYDFIVEKLNNSTTENKYLPDYARSLAKIKTKKAYQALNEFYKTKVAVLNEYTGSLYTLKDSLELAKELFPTVLEAFVKDTTENYSLISLTKALLDSGIIAYDMIKPFEAGIIKLTNRFVGQKTDQKAIFDSYVNENLLAIINHSDNRVEKYQYFNDLLRSENNWMTYYASYYLLKNNQAINTKVISTIAKHPHFRNLMISDFKDLKRMDMFPAKYNNQLSFSEAELYRFAYDYDEIELSKMDFICKKSILYNEKKAEFYFFKIKYSDDEDYYLGYCGPYYGGEELSISGEKTGIYYDEVYTKGLENSHILKLLE